MAGIRWPPEDSDLFPARPPAGAPADLVSDDDRSVAADSWSIKSDYGSTLDDEQRHVDASEVLSSCNFPTASEYNSDKDVPDASEVETSLLGLQSYWDATYAVELTSFHEHGHPGQIWFGAEVMDVLVNWTKNICANIYQDQHLTDENNSKPESSNAHNDVSSWSVLDIGSGNGLLLQELAKRGFSDLTGIDFSEGAIELARSLAARGGFTDFNFVVDDVLETKLGRTFDLVIDKGTLDVIGLHPDGPVRRMMYWDSVSNLVVPGGILVITSCNSTREELLQEVQSLNRRKLSSQEVVSSSESTIFHYLDHIETYPTVSFAGVDECHIITIAFTLK